MQLSEGELSRLLGKLKEPETGGGVERRRARRIQLVTRATVHVLDGAPNRTFSVLTRDISSSGLGLIAASPLERGWRVSIDIAEGERRAGPFVCEVRYCRALADGLWGVGVEFVDEAPSKDRSQSETV